MSNGRARLAPTACSLAARAIDEPLAGTAPFARGWIAIEQSGPFGRDALTQSHFPTDIGAQLVELAGNHGIRPELIRQVGPHADDHNAAARTVLLACSQPGLMGLLEMRITDPAELLTIDFAALAAGSLDHVHPRATPKVGNVLLVCAHAKRDICCAILGRPTADALTADETISMPVWECSHLGGHRFAATAAVLPSGWVFGRIETVATRVVADFDHGEVTLAHARGRSSLTPAAQFADLQYRLMNGVPGVDDTRVTEVASGVFIVSAPGHPSLKLRVESSHVAAERPQSCGADVTHVTLFTHEVM